MTKFKLGDRIAVYVYTGRYIAQVISLDSADGRMRVNSNYGACEVHAKQCRLLVKNKIKRRRIVMIKRMASLESNFHEILMALNPGETVEFVEVTRRKV